MKELASPPIANAPLERNWLALAHTQPSNGSHGTIN